jgi:hypothetical protein
MDIFKREQIFKFETGMDSDKHVTQYVAWLKDKWERFVGVTGKNDIRLSIQGQKQFDRWLNTQKHGGK